MDRIKAMAEGDFLVVATDGALVKVMESTPGGWKSVPHMGGGYAEDRREGGELEDTARRGGPNRWWWDRWKWN